MPNCTSTNDILVENQQLRMQIQLLQEEKAKSSKKKQVPKLTTIRATLLTAPEIIEQLKKQEEEKKRKKKKSSTKKPTTKASSATAEIPAKNTFAIKSIDNQANKLILKRHKVPTPSRSPIR
jgi:Zn-dependent M32 family carboxypeptidase